MLLARVLGVIWASVPVTTCWHLQGHWADLMAEETKHKSQKDYQPYHILLRKNTTMSVYEHAGWTTRVHEQDPGVYRGVLLHTIIDIPHKPGQLKSYQAEISQSTVERLRNHRDVEAVHANPDWLSRVADKLGLQINFTYDAGERDEHGNLRYWPDGWTTNVSITEPGIEQEWYEKGHADAPWSLIRISHPEEFVPLHGARYRFNAKASAGTYIYVLADGVDEHHIDVKGRVRHGFDATEAYLGKAREPQNMVHGTHVASLAAGERCGVATRATIVNVKVLRNPLESDYRGGDRDQALESGLLWTLRDIQMRGHVGRAVVNLSYAFDRNPDSDDPFCEWIGSMIKKFMDSGILVVFGAGDNNMDVQFVQPGCFEYGVTVAAIERNLTRWQHSNYGEAVDIFAPGVGLLAATANTRDGYEFVTGTAVAAPYVSGVIAYLLGIRENVEVLDMWERVRDLSIKGVIKDARGTANRMLYNGFEEKFQDHGVLIDPS